MKQQNERLNCLVISVLTRISAYSSGTIYSTNIGLTGPLNYTARSRQVFTVRVRPRDSYIEWKINIVLCIMFLGRTMLEH